jgi:hypothetical protein
MLRPKIITRNLAMAFVVESSSQVNALTTIPAIPPRIKSAAIILTTIARFEINNPLFRPASHFPFKEEMDQLNCLVYSRMSPEQSAHHLLFPINRGQTGRYPNISRRCSSVQNPVRCDCDPLLMSPGVHLSSARVYRILSSNTAMNSGVPRGLPVCVHCRIAVCSASEVCAARYSRQDGWLHCCCQVFISRMASGSAVPQCAAALNH